MPAIAFGQPATISDVLGLVERRVSDAAGFARERVFTFVGDPVVFTKTPPAEQFVVVQPEDFPVQAGSVAGGGAAFTVWGGRFRLHVFARLGTDRELTDTRLMRDRSLGVAERVRRVAKAVQVWTPLDATGLLSPLC